LKLHLFLIHSTVGYVTMKENGSGNSSFIASVRSSVHWNICI